MKYTVKIQSVSDIITNSSSEIFTVVNTDYCIREAIQELYNKYVREDKWNFSGDVRGLEMWTLCDEWEAIRGENEQEYDEKIIIEYDFNNYDAIVTEFIEHIDYEHDYAFIDAFYLSTNEFIRLQSLIYSINFNWDSVFLQFDNTNPDFVEDLKELLGESLIKIE